MKLTFGLAGAALAIAAAVGPAMAVETSNPVTYDACVTNSTGVIKIVSASAKCGKGEHKISWNKVGPAGQPGPAGVTAGYASYSLDNTSVTLPGSGSEPVPVGKLTLPAGNFIVNVTALTGGWLTAPDSVSCYLFDGDGGFPIAYGAASLAEVPGSYSDASIAITVSDNVAGDMQLLCTDQAGQAVISNVSITATQVTTLQSNGHATTQRADQPLGRVELPKTFKR